MSIFKKKYPKNKKDDEQNEFEDVYAGPEQMGKRASCEGVYAGPEAFDVKEFKCVYAGPQYFGVPVKPAEVEEIPEPEEIEEEPDTAPEELKEEPDANVEEPKAEQPQTPPFTPPPSSMFMAVYAGPEIMSNPNYRPIGAYVPPEAFEKKGKYCPECGMPVSETAKFCENCGTPVKK